MTETDSLSDETLALRSSIDFDDDCPLPVATQNWNIVCYTTYWAMVYLIAPVSYIGSTHANILKNLGNDDRISNLPLSMYLWLTVIPILVSWIFPHPRYLKPLAMFSIAITTTATAAVAIVLGSSSSRGMSTLIVIAHGALFGAAGGFLFTALWDLLRRGVSTSRRGKVLGYTFGIGPLFACVGSLFQGACLKEDLVGNWNFGLEFPFNYVALFATAAPLIIVSGAAILLFVVPPPEKKQEIPPLMWEEIRQGLKQFIGTRTLIITVLIYVIVYSGGNAILNNLSLLAKNVLGAETDTVGTQNFLRFGFKAVAGALLGLLLAKANPRATLLATTSVLLAGITWVVICVTYDWNWLFLIAFGILGAGELFGAHFPNYLVTASRKKYVRINMAYLGVLSALIGFSSYAFGAISKYYGELQGEMQGRLITVYLAGGILILGLVLTLALLPANPTPREETAFE